MSEPPRPPLSPRPAGLPPLQPPPLPPPVSRRRRPVSRACDRCRRRKARCDYFDSVRSCTLCREAEVECTFDLPLARRGPKAKKRDGSATATPLSPPLRDAGPDASFASAATPSRTSDVAPHTSGRQGIERVAPQHAHGGSLSALQRWLQLSRAPALQHTTLEQMVNRCLALFFQNLYPLTPLVHEPSLRDGVAYFIAQSSRALALRETSAASTPESRTAHSHASHWPSGGSLDHWPEATFTLITAVCAEAAFLLPRDVFPEGETVADTFLQASRGCLYSYLEADLDHPNANSITIRYFHSNCVHAAGKPSYSWHIFGEATRLAQIMQLHDESALRGLSPVEAELRRRTFYIVSMGDKSAAILNNRPITIHKYSFDSGITTLYPTGMEGDVINGSSPGSNVTTSESPGSFIDGFNANLRLWQAAADILLEIRLLQDRRQYDPGVVPGTKFAVTAAERQHLDCLYVRFITCLDNLPPYLQSYTFAAVAGGDRDTAQPSQFIIQCANLQVSFHCLRMVITQKFEDISYFAPGMEQADLRKTEIVRDMLRVMHEAPFWALQLNGEPYVEKIRIIGASLLAIIHRNGDSPLGIRARGDFSVLLDILTRLDSKASDALRSDSTLPS